MRRVMVRYQVKPEHLAENEALLRAVYEELEATQPKNLAYVTFKLDDGVTFVHVAEDDETPGHSPLNELPSFKKYLENVRERLEAPPEQSSLTEIGAFRVFDSQAAKSG
jgi:hypothetical protein